MNKFESYYADKFEFKNLDLSLSRIDNALTQAGFNEKSLGKIIHIAGTNGKGSTSYFLYQMLQLAGFKTALFTSPHILKINERISYNLSDITDDEMDNIFTANKDIIINNNLSYFEAVFFTAALFFAEKSPDFTILETGLGGKYDATNTNTINNKLCVITSMGQDHTAYLGNNIYGIINEKLGILRDNSTLVLAYNKPFVLNHIKKTVKNIVKSIDKEMIIEDIDYPYPYNENYTTASYIYKLLLNKEFKYNKNLKLPPCRMEKIGNIILDGSHNMPGILKIINTWKKQNISAVIFTVTNDRNIENTAEILKHVSNNLIVTTLPGNIRSIDECKNNNVIFIQSPKDALEYALNSYNGTILVTGSFYLCAYIKEYLNGRKNEK
ncbi:MAG: Mur ligase family protein [Mucispirillum sp.]|nr:Mur ligase family protein [Mucispirillum sp.]